MTRKKKGRKNEIYKQEKTISENKDHRMKKNGDNEGSFSKKKENKEMKRKKGKRTEGEERKKTVEK